MNRPATDVPVLVTGGSRGLGRAVALALASDGHPVAIVFHHRQEAADAAVAAIRSSGGRAVAIQSDVSSPADVERMTASARAAFGSVRALVHCAGIGPVRGIGEATIEDFDQAMAVNARSAFLVAEACLPGMISDRFGRLIFLSSIAARTGGVISAPYAASKAAVEGLTHYYASALLRHRITANAVSPAFIDTDMLAGVTLPPMESLPLGRMGRPDEVASVVALLIGNEFMTGQTIHVNAGRYMT